MVLVGCNEIPLEIASPKNFGKIYLSKCGLFVSLIGDDFITFLFLIKNYIGSCQNEARNQTGAYTFLGRYWVFVMFLSNCSLTVTSGSPPTTVLTYCSLQQKVDQICQKSSNGIGTGRGDWTHIIIYLYFCVTDSPKTECGKITKCFLN